MIVLRILALCVIALPAVVLAMAVGLVHLVAAWGHVALAIVQGTTGAFLEYMATEFDAEKLERWVREGDPKKGPPPGAA